MISIHLKNWNNVQIFFPFLCWYSYRTIKINHTERHGFTQGGRGQWQINKCTSRYSPTLIRWYFQLANIIISSIHLFPSYWRNLLTNKWTLYYQPKLVTKFSLSQNPPFYIHLFYKREICQSYIRRTFTNSYLEGKIISCPLWYPCIAAHGFTGWQNLNININTLEINQGSKGIRQ